MIEQMIGKIARQKIGKKMAPKRKKGRDPTFFVDSLVLLCLSDLSENCVCVCVCVCEAEVSSDSSCRLGLKPPRLKAAALKLVYIPKKGITEYLNSLKVDYRVAQLCIYQKIYLSLT